MKIQFSHLNQSFSQVFPRFSAVEPKPAGIGAPMIVDSLDLKALPPGRHHFWLNLLPNVMGGRTQVPVMVLKGKERGPVIGLTSAVHGNELNGIPVIGEIFDKIQPENLKGTILAVPVMNIRGFMQNHRMFENQGTTQGKADLNRLMSGSLKGEVEEAEFYAKALTDKIVKQCDYIFDLHGLGFMGKMKSYIIADGKHPIAWKMAQACRPEYICETSDMQRIGNLRSEGVKMGIPTVTFEIGGSPHAFEYKEIEKAKHGLLNAFFTMGWTKTNLADLKLISSKTKVIGSYAGNHTHNDGGLVELKTKLGDVVAKGQLIGHLRDVFWQPIKTLYAKEPGEVIAVASNPVKAPGGGVIYVSEPKREIAHDINHGANSSERVSGGVG
ncbi:MAG: succinylglutamate desuccinylase/aspartoacylase family protein [Vampirovibrio sp.]|nr:succinylglutamate desuccinylase/aspartoacylase family protein [Vampirovibrio sp.]